MLRPLGVAAPRGRLIWTNSAAESRREDESPLIGEPSLGALDDRLRSIIGYDPVERFEARHPAATDIDRTHKGTFGYPVG